MRDAAEQRDELDLLVVQILLAAAAVVVVGPALILGVPLAIDQRGWRRWPWFLAGGAAVAGAVALGAWDAYWATWIEVWRTLRHGAPLDASAPLGFVPLAAPAGWRWGRPCRSAYVIAMNTNRPATIGRSAIGDAPRSRSPGR